MRSVQKAAARALLVALVALGGREVLACGDKLLAIGRGVRFQRLYAARQANLVIYAGGQNGALHSARLETALRRGVHHLQVVQGGSQLQEALKSGQVDVVLVDVADVAAIARQVQSTTSRPVVLPILAKPSKAEYAAAQKEYTLALKANADDLEYLAAIDEAMKLKLKRSARS